MKRPTTGHRTILLSAVLVSGALGLAGLAEAAPAWRGSLDEGLAEARKTRRPVLVVAIAPGVAAEQWADQLVREIPADTFVLVRLRADDREPLRLLGIAAAPAVRLVDGTGAVGARLDRIDSTDTFNAWLKTAQAAASSPASQADVAENIPSLIAAIGSADVVAREAAIRRLQSLPTAAPAVVEALKSDDLTTRISAGELLETWRAPTDKIDPWERSTLTADRLAALGKWAAEQKAAPEASPATSPTTSPAMSLVAAGSAASGGVALDLDHLVVVPTASETLAIRERLARSGTAVMPLVLERLKAAKSDESRRRLSAVRYRLVMSEPRTRSWPTGADQLTAPDEPTRRAAMAELIGAAQAEDVPLLQELFSHDDALIREQALGALRSIGGDKAAASLMHLLSDPEPNVRAAVLKALSGDDKTDPSLAPQLQKYVATETDADLVGHAVRVFQAMPGDAPVEALVSLLSHSSWRVRAEATEALGTKLKRSYGEQAIAPTVSANAYAKILERLEDEEPFVVSRATGALSGSDIASAAAEVLKVVKKRPELAKQLLPMLAQNQDQIKASFPALRELAKHEIAEVRAAAVSTLGASADPAIGGDLKAAIVDADPGVRMAAVEGTIKVIEMSRPRDGYIETSGFMGFGRSRKRVDVNKWIEDFRAGKGRPPFMKDVLPAIEKDLPSLKGTDRIRAAIVLTAGGKDDLAFPILLEAAAAAQTQQNAAKAMPWLGEDRRIELYQKLRQTAGEDELESAVEILASIPSTKVVEVFWKELSERKQVDDTAALLGRSILAQYVGEDRYGNEELSSERARYVQVVKRHTSEGPEVKRAVALEVLLGMDPSAAGPTAAAMSDDPSLSKELRRDAFVARLLADRDADVIEPVAVKAVEDELFRDLAVRYLGGGKAAVSGGRGGVRLFKYHYSGSDFFGARGTVITVEGPKDLPSAPLKPLLASDDEQLKAYAAYLLVLNGDNTAFPTLEKVWRTKPIDDSPFTPNVYRAIARMNDDARTPVLEEIYNVYLAENRYQLGTFYWTIRSIKGEQILKLRKRIRDDVGMDELR